MKINAAEVRKCLKSFDFKTLFREHLGWDNHQAQLDIPVDDNIIHLTAVAQKRGFVAFICSSIPDRPTRLKIDHQVTKSVREHFIIYTDETAGLQVWQWVRREPGKPLASRDHRFDASQSGDPLIQRLDQIAVSLDEEENITVVDVAGRARAAFDVDKVTKKFYDRFKAEHDAFLKLVKGIKSTADLQWYTSLMLNRLMFVYFIQKKGFLDGDTDYLRNRLAMVQQVKGRDRFQSFYRYFLLRLFHDGLGKAPDERTLDATMEKLLGKVPFLNGGFFEVHELEEHNPDIDIPDNAFEKLFDFFDKYRWHLDERPLRADNEINPDVVGYIFEKYINQKQMGAYYTKEDITEYISKNTIIPFLFDAAEKKCAIAFKPDSALWRLLRDDPDRYIYEAVRRGVIDDNGNIIPLPKEIEAGVKDVSKRDGWNRRADAPFALPTETWREHVHRRQRCLDIREKLRKGEVHQINDLITLNLDIWQFARDAIINAEGPELLRAFWHAIQKVTVLDPTCGSGAFLFAALRILETLYSDCLERMERFVEDLAATPGKHHPRQFSDFKKVLAQIDKHPSDRYFILKSIIINNIFGVDIMEEAVEICKLRLFLKLVSQVETVEQIEPLPDVDFNIRAGNTLVGYTTLDQVRKSHEGVLGFGDKVIRRIEEDAELVNRAYRHFRDQQTNFGGKVTAEDKLELRRRLDKLDAELDRYLAGEYGISENKYRSKTTYEKAFTKWKESHEPFHWFVEFYGIMSNGGFDVIIGNPPYISASKVRKEYTLREFASSRCSDIYAWCLERASQLAHDHAYTGMIVPLSLTFSREFSALRTLLFSTYRTNWFSSYGRIPAALFAHDVRVRNTIHIGSKQGDGQQYTTRLHRWFDVERPHLLPALSYAPFDPAKWLGRVPKLNTASLISAFEDASCRGNTLEHALSNRPTQHTLYFKKTAYNWLNFCRELPPCYDENGRPIAHTQYDKIAIPSSDVRDALLLILNSKLQFAFWIAVGDDFHVAHWMYGDLPVDITSLMQAESYRLETFANELDATMRNAVSFKLNAGKRVGNYNLARCRHVTDKSDSILARLFGFEDVWDDIELLYTQVVRTDFSDNDIEGDDT